MKYLFHSGTVSYHIDLHYYTTYIKFGIGRATYDSSQEIRNGEIERKEGIDLVKKFDGEYPLRFERELFEYLSINKKEFPQAYKKFDIPEIDREYFFKIADKFRSPHLWYYSDEKQKWYLRKSIFNQES